MDTRRDLTLAEQMNARRDANLAGYTRLAAPPSVGETVIHAPCPDYRPTMRTVVAVRDHRPVDGTPTKNAIVEFVGGEWAYWWNLYEGD